MAKCIGVFDLEQHRADDQRMTSKYCESDSKACGAIDMHYSCLFSVALAVLWCHTAIVLRAQCRCIRWRHIRLKPARESKTMTEAEDQTSSRILSAPSCFKSQVPGQHDWNVCKALYFFCSFCWTFDYYIHVQVQGFGKFHGSRYFKYTLCVCSWNV